MKQSRGFTLIELLITITIMVILLTLGVVSLRGNQASARDEERKSDALAIAQQLENYYKNGSDATPPSGMTYTASQYPPTTYFDTEAHLKLALPDIDPKVLRAPDVSEGDPMSFMVATNTNAQTPTINQYIYQPLNENGNLCTGQDSYYNECFKFTLYYKLETNSTVQKIESNHQ